MINTFDESYNSSFEVTEDNDAYFLSIDLPGFEKKEISISLKKDELNISAKSDKKQRSKSITLPSDTDTGKISANLKNGVLKITVPKAKESSLVISIN